MPLRFEPRSHPDCGGLPQPPVLQLACVGRDFWPLVRFPQTRVIVESLYAEGEWVYRGRMSGLGQTRPFGVPNSTSAVEGRPDVTVSKGDIAILMSGVGGGADVKFGGGFVCF